jgi:predicted  nucleic acid-binding Zn-ribbon protein
LKGRIAALESRLAAADREAQEIGGDQARLRENIKALKETAEAKQLIARYAAKATEQESRIEQLTQERRAGADERARLQADLETAIRAFALDRKLYGAGETRGPQSRGNLETVRKVN